MTKDKPEILVHWDQGAIREGQWSRLWALLFAPNGNEPNVDTKQKECNHSADKMP